MSPMNNRRMTPTQEPGVLDFAPGAAAAYSLRNLSLSYSGPVVTVRRSTDSAEADFTASEVSDGTLAAWCGGGDGFVKQWWSQTGINHASNSTAAYQPQLIDAGSLITDGGKAAVQFDGSDDYLTATPLAVSQPAFFVSLQRLAVGNPATYQKPYDGILSGSRMNVYRGINVSPYKYGLYAGVPDLYSSQEFQQSQEVWAALFSGADSYLYVNGGLALQGNPGSESISGLRIGADNDLNTWWNGTISELILYPTDQTALRQRIEGNINRYFGVF